MAAVPQPILDYLDAIRRFDGNALLAAFAPDAVVVDERGRLSRPARDRRLDRGCDRRRPARGDARLTAPGGAEQRVVADISGPNLARPLGPP